MHDPRVVDVRQRMVDVAGLDDEAIGHSVAVLDALRDWREAESRLSEASRAYMKLGDSDMRALRYVIVMTDRGDVATARGIAQHLGISSAATTKLLDRLERGGHITRDSHPSDRRALVISVTPETHRSAMSTVGRQQARRFNAAARLSPSEREVVIGFLTDMADELSLAHAPWAAGPPA